MDSFTLLAIPLFILAGSIMGHGGIARRIVNVSLVFVGRIKGGLGFVVIIATMFFSGVCGSASADTAAIGAVTLPEMLKRKYPPAFATALLAASGGTATLIPPSIDLIIIGVVAGISIGGLFAAGFLPGLVNALALMALTYYYGRKLDLPVMEPTTWSEKLRTLGDGILAILMPVIILGGILGGVFTPTEASAVAVFYGLIVSIFIYRELKLSHLPVVLLDACKLTGVVMLVLGMASAFSFVLAFERIPHEIAQFIVAHAETWIVFVIFVNILFLDPGHGDGRPAGADHPDADPGAGRGRARHGPDPYRHLHRGQRGAFPSSRRRSGSASMSPAASASYRSKAVVRPLIPFLLVLVATLLVISYVPDITLFLPRLLGYTDG